LDARQTPSGSTEYEPADSSRLLATAEFAERTAGSGFGLRRALSCFSCRRLGSPTRWSLHGSSLHLRGRLRSILARLFFWALFPFWALFFFRALGLVGAR